MTPPATITTIDAGALDNYGRRYHVNRGTRHINRLGHNDYAGLWRTVAIALTRIVLSVPLIIVRTVISLVRVILTVALVWIALIVWLVIPLVRVVRIIILSVLSAVSLVGVVLAVTETRYE